jgi:hypothetical protein
MRIARRIPMATNTHSEYVILIAFPLQQWLQERVPVSRFACLVTVSEKVYREYEVIKSKHDVQSRVMEDTMKSASQVTCCAVADKRGWRRRATSQFRTPEVPGSTGRRRSWHWLLVSVVLFSPSTRIGGYTTSSFHIPDYSLFADRPITEAVQTKVLTLSFHDDDDDDDDDDDNINTEVHT